MGSWLSDGVQAGGSSGGFFHHCVLAITAQARLVLITPVLRPASASAAVDMTSSSDLFRQAEELMGK